MPSKCLSRVLLALALTALASCAALRGIESIGPAHVRADQSFAATLDLIDLPGWVAAGAPLGDRALLDVSEREAVQANIDAWRLHVAQAAARVEGAGGVE